MATVGTRQLQPDDLAGSPALDGPARSVYNITINFGALLDATARLWSMMHGGDDFVDSAGADHGGRNSWDIQGAYGSRDHPPPPPGMAPLPGPWGFMTSGYLLGLIAMAILLNRIQNIVVPTRRPFPFRFQPRRERSRMSYLRLVYWSLFPLDFSSTTCRLAFRIPTLYLLIKSLSIWSCVILQVFDLSFLSSWPLVEQGCANVARMETERICWQSFVAVSCALVVESLTKGLEGAFISPNTSPFNLFGYAFLLHIYSSPITHVTKLEGLPSRPDKHVVFTILMPLLQLTIIHTLGIKQRWSRQRLIPTAMISIISLIHFHAVLWISPSSYPLLNYMPCLFETALATVTLLTIGLNALTQLLLEGAITRPLFGHRATLLPKWDEDFSIALLRLGTASLEATSVSGFGNEVGGVTLPASLAGGAPSSSTAGGAPALEEYGTVEMSKVGVVSVSGMTEQRGQRRAVRRGLWNEIRTVKAGAGEPSAGDVWIDSAWYRELACLAGAVGRFCRGFWRMLLALLSRRRAPPLLPPLGSTTSAEGNSGTHVVDDDDTYERFLRGDLSDDDGSDAAYEDEEESEHIDGTPSSDTPDGASVQDQDDATEAAELLADLTASPPAPSPRIMLAHMAGGGGGEDAPLTRRRYARLLSERAHADELEPAGETEPWESAVAARRRSAARQAAQEGDGGLDETRRNCVICTVEPRQIICWPCRCLALCDDCRENLASRSSASKHTCPCCRRTVEGYSKIYIP